jgi:hypothetical protein
MPTQITSREIEVVLKRKFVTLLTLGIASLGTSGARAADPSPHSPGRNPLIGGWKADHYYLQDGSSYPLLGQILFTSSNWTVLFIVVQDGKPQRGSGEGGDYAVDGNKVVFTHRYVASTPAPAIPGLKEQQARALEWEPSHAENSTFVVQGDRLTLLMPSGNRLTWTRSSH